MLASASGRPHIGVMADDLTGSCDIGSMFAKRGCAVRIFTSTADWGALAAGLVEEAAGAPGPCPEGNRHRATHRRADVLILDTDSRMDPPATAYEKVRRAAAALRSAGCRFYYKKTCSVFRGNIGSECDALLDELGESFAVAVAAFPKNGRVTRGGVHYVRGRPLAESEFGRDPAHPTTESNLIEVWRRQTGRRVGSVPLAAVRQGPAAIRAALESARAAGVAYALCDAETNADLAAIGRAAARERVLIGASALAEELGRPWGPKARCDAPGGFDEATMAVLARPAAGPGVLVLAGSITPQSQAQVATLAASGAPVFTLDGRAALAEPDAALARLAREAARAIARGRIAVVRSENWPEAAAATRALGAEQGLDAIAVNRHVAGLLGRVAEAVLRTTGCRRLIALGGDTAAAACRALNVTEMVVLREIEPGLPSILAPGPPPLLLVLKAGGFGEPDFLMRAIEHLGALGGVCAPARDAGSPPGGGGAGEPPARRKRP